MSADHRVLPSLRGNAVLWWLVPVALLAALVGWEIDWGRRVHYLPDPPATIERHFVPTPERIVAAIDRVVGY